MYTFYKHQGGMEVMKALYVLKTSELLLSGVPASVSASRVK